MKGNAIMTYLKIKNGKGYFLNSGKEEKEIDAIRKEDILFLLDCATKENIQFEMDKIENGNIQNEAHKIIYGNIYNKFEDLLTKKNMFLDESENLYKDALKKYQN